MDEKLTMKQLTQHYIDRYELPITAYSDGKHESDGGFGTYQTAIERKIKDAKIAGTSLWVIIKPKKGVRAISIDDFERHCFKAWRDYVRNHNHNESALQADEERLLPYLEQWDWEKEAKEAIHNQNTALEQGYIPGSEDVDVPEGVSKEDVRLKGISMMIEAVFAKLYGKFLWDKLEKDMIASTLLSDSPYKAAITPEYLQAKQRLGSYLNYVVEKNVVTAKKPRNTKKKDG